MSDSQNQNKSFSADENQAAPSDSDIMGVVPDTVNDDSSIAGISDPIQNLDIGEAFPPDNHATAGDGPSVIDSPQVEVNHDSPSEAVAADSSSAVQPDEDFMAEDIGVSASISIDPSDWSNDETDDVEADDSQLDDFDEDDDNQSAPPSENAPELSDQKKQPAEKEDIDFNSLRKTLMALQQQIRAAEIPVVIVFEGWDAAGKGTLLSKLIEGLDPRGYQVYPIREPSELERRYPPMRRYWIKMPAKGNISIFCSSWYREVSDACFENKSARKRLLQSYNEIIDMESELVADGVLIIKFFLHISRKEQKRRLKALDAKKNTRWRVTKADWEQNDHYEEYLRLYDAMIARTHFDGMLWHVLRSDDRQICLKQVYDTVISAFRSALEDRAANKRLWDTPFLPHLESTAAKPFPQLEAIDPEQALFEPYKPTVDKAQKSLFRLQNELYRRQIPMAICFEGWDAAGKGGAIRRLTASLDARGFDVVPIAAPTPLEKSHHHLWRFWKTLPKDGHIAIFDRTWYGRVMVERIEGFCTESQWKRAYEEMNRFEEQMIAHGIILCKFWLQIDNDTQLTRFKDRENVPDKEWKITAEDWRNREKWPQYEEAINDMLQKTNTAYAPWTVVEANNKQFARVKVLDTVIHAIEDRLDSGK